MTRREAATVIAALLYYANHAKEVLGAVAMPAGLGAEVPLSWRETAALVGRLAGGEGQEGEDGNQQP